ncbi:hypothetical protein BDV19DRAFT_395060 [Aspergillus venezuelensis]
MFFLKQQSLLFALQLTSSALVAAADTNTPSPRPPATQPTSTQSSQGITTSSVVSSGSVTVTAVYQSTTYPKYSTITEPVVVDTTDAGLHIIPLTIWPSGQAWECIMNCGDADGQGITIPLPTAAPDSIANSDDSDNTVSNGDDEDEEGVNSDSDTPDNTDPDFDDDQGTDGGDSGGDTSEDIDSDGDGEDDEDDEDDEDTDEVDSVSDGGESGSDGGNSGSNGGESGSNSPDNEDEDDNDSDDDEPDDDEPESTTTTTTTTTTSTSTTSTDWFLAVLETGTGDTFSITTADEAASVLSEISSKWDDVGASTTIGTLTTSAIPITATVTDASNCALTVVASGTVAPLCGPGTIYENNSPTCTATTVAGLSVINCA